MQVQARDFTIDFSKGALVMGILNVTPDSFSDGGRFFHGGFRIDEDKVIETALQLIEDGADMIDVGGESTRPGAPPVSPDEEKRRVLGVIAKLSKKISVPISIDTYKATVAEAALQSGASMVNDISGFREDAAMPRVVSQFSAAVVVMHSLERPSDMAWSYNDHTKYSSLIQDVKDHLQKTIIHAEAFGIRNIIIDVGFGFGKSAEDNFLLLKHLKQFTELGRPILAGLSLKSFIGKAIANRDIPPPSQRLYGTIAAETIAIANGANVLRTHNVRAAKDAIRTWKMM